jgi:hypothetical protein
MTGNEKSRADPSSLKSSKVANVKINSESHKKKLIHGPDSIGFKRILCFILDFLFREIFAKDLYSFGRKKSGFRFHWMS